MQEKQIEPLDFSEAYPLFEVYYQKRFNVRYEFGWKSFEERRTVNRVDNDGICEIVFEISLGMPPRYIYDDEKPYDEPVEVYNQVIQAAVGSWNSKNPNYSL